jgi:hypothetical protein
LEYGMEELGPMGSPPASPLTSIRWAPYAITLRALCDKPLHQVHSQLDELCQIAISERQYQRLPLDDSAEMVIRDYKE